MTTEFPTILEKFYYWEQTTPNDVFLRQPINRIWREYTWEEVGNQARRIASALKDLGLPEGSRIALISKNCAEWFIADLAIMLNGFISVPLYAQQPDDAMRYVLNHSGAEVVFVGKLDDPAHIQSIIPDNITQIAMPYEGVSTELQWNDLLTKYSPLAENYYPTLDDIFTLIYTSGTTGNPKGVVHTYRKPAFVIEHGMPEFNVKRKDSLFSFLPLAHVVERMLVEVGSFYTGNTVSFSESLETFSQDLYQVQPTVFFSVPRLWTKFQFGILEKMPQGKLDKLLSIPLINGFVKKRIRKALGLSRAHLILSGAAPVPVPMMEWFGKIGINIQEAYGATEALCYGFFNRKDDIRMGTVGKPLPELDVKLDENGEILLRCGSVMVGYYMEPDKTEETMVDGYYRTGDVGEFDNDGYLKITGRIKDAFKTQKGEFVSPAEIENKFAENTFIEQICILGRGLVQPLALVMLSESAQSHPKQYVHKKLKHTMDKINQDLKSHEVLNGMIVVKDEWLPDNGFMTPTLKIKRNIMEKYYQPLMEQYSECREVVWE